MGNGTERVNTMNSNEMTTELYEIATEELKQFEDRLDTAEKAKVAAYELSVKRDILMAIESVKDESIINELKKYQYPLDAIYCEWLHNDYYDAIGDLRNSIKSDMAELDKTRLNEAIYDVRNQLKEYEDSLTTADKVKNAAYELVIKRDIVDLFAQAALLNDYYFPSQIFESANLLDEVYYNWLRYDSAELGDCLDMTIKDVCNDIGKDEDINLSDNIYRFDNVIRTAKKIEDALESGEIDLDKSGKSNENVR